MTAYIIIPVHNRLSTTSKCLETLYDNINSDDFQIVVVDDGSIDGTSEHISSNYPNITILYGDGSLWWTGAINLGMQYSYNRGADYLIWLNDDCLVTSETLEHLINFCKKNARSIIGCQGYDLEKPSTVNFGGKFKSWKGYKINVFPENTVNQCDLLSGNLVCIPRTVVEQIGFPDPNVLPHYGGDTLYLIKARKSGFKIFTDTYNCVYDIPSESRLSPKRWMLKSGKAMSILGLIFVPESILSWRVNFLVNWADYHIFGIPLFVYTYIIKLVFPLIFISILRFMPISIRYNLSHYKNFFKLKLYKS